METTDDERTLILIKREILERKRLGEIITRIERKGFEIENIKLLTPNNQLMEKHYHEHKDKPFFNTLTNHFTKGKVLAMIVKGFNVISSMRSMVGLTDPNLALPGTIRFDYCSILQKNGIHASDSFSSAVREIKLWFGNNENPENLQKLNYDL